jgi:SAM-dependent methyltransferase
VDKDFSSLFLAFKQFQLAFTAVKIGLPKILHHGPKTLMEIAQATHLDERRLLRVLRGLVWSGILASDENGRYSLSEAGAALVSDDPRSQAQGIRFQGEFFYRAWGSLHEYLLTGEIPFERAHGIGQFELLKQDENLACLYSDPMAARSSEYSDAVARRPVFDAAELVVDVGDGTGRLLLDILRVRPRIRGIVFDLAVLQRRANELINQSGLSDRCRFVAGDMFDEIPSGGNVYLLKWILHDWDDQRAILILQNCVKAMTKDSRLLILERLMPERITSFTGLVQADLNMLCSTGGAERTLDEYRALLAQGGAELVSSNQVENYYGFVALEARPRNA